MRTFFEDDSINSLIGRVLSKFGKPSITPADCKSLSDAVLAETKKTISETTLKRLFGFARRSFDFSIYTLDTLAEYIGYSNWENFYNASTKELTKESGVADNKWQLLKKTCNKYSAYTLQTIKNGSGIPFAQTIHREELTSFIKKFLLTKQSIAPVIAPAGFGKSVSMAHSVLKLWQGDNPVFPNDICCFINLHQVQTIALYKHSLTEWMSKYLHLLYDEIASLVESREKDARLVIIIEGFDEKTFSTEKLKLIYANITEFVNYNNKYHWVKIILNMRPSAWARMVHAYFNPSFFHNRVFIDNSYPNENTVHHTLPFTPAEITKLLAVNMISQTQSNTFSKDFFDFLTYPKFLDILLAMIVPNADDLQSEEALIYRILDTDIKHHSQFDTYASMKGRIIDKIVTPRTEGALSDTHNDWMFAKDNATAISYSQLIDDHVIVEEKSYRGTPPFHKQITFSNKFLEYYHTGSLLLRKNGQVINTPLIDTIFTNPHLQLHRHGILKWYLLQALYAQNGNTIQEIFNSRHVHAALKLQYFDFLVNLSDGNDAQKKLIESLLVSNDFIEQFFDQGLLYQHIGAVNNKLLVTLFSLSTQDKWKYCSLVLLFLNAMLHLQTYHAEAYLREYRKLAVDTHSPQINFARDIMTILLDFARYDITAEQLPELLRSFTDDVLQNRTAGNCTVHLNMILAVYGLLYMESFQELHRFAIALQAGLTPEQKEAYGFIRTLSDYAGKYATLMHKGIDSLSARKAAEEIVLKENNIPETDVLNKTLFYLLSARYYEKKKDIPQCVSFAQQASKLARSNQLHLFSLLSFRILKQAYLLSNQTERAAETDTDMKQLLTTDMQDAYTSDVALYFRN